MGISLITCKQINRYHTFPCSKIQTPVVFAYVSIIIFANNYVVGWVPILAIIYSKITSTDDSSCLPSLELEFSSSVDFLENAFDRSLLES